MYFLSEGNTLLPSQRELPLGVLGISPWLDDVDVSRWFPTALLGTFTTRAGGITSLQTTGLSGAALYTVARPLSQDNRGNGMKPL